MSYYTSKVQPQQAANAYDMARRGSPPNACFIPDKPVTYCCVGTTAVDFMLHLRSWAGSGRCERRTITPKPNELDRVSFEVDGDPYEVFIHDYSAWHAGTRDNFATRFAIKERASEFFFGVDVELPRSMQRGNNLAAVARHYQKRKREALARYMPEGFMPLPADFVAAYRRVSPLEVEVVYPTTKALTLTASPEEALRRTRHTIHKNMVAIKGAEFIVTGQVLGVALQETGLMNLPDRVGWAEVRSGNTVYVTTPYNVSTRPAQVHLDGNLFTYDDVTYRLAHKRIVVA